MYIFLKGWNARSKTCCGQNYSTMAIVNKKHTYIAIKLKGANKINARPYVKHIQ
jgi:hypothetical protein